MEWNEFDVYDEMGSGRGRGCGRRWWHGHGLAV
jgi:hypothetical protein